VLFFFLLQAELSTTDQPAFDFVLFLNISIQFSIRFKKFHDSNSKSIILKTFKMHFPFGIWDLGFDTWDLYFSLYQYKKRQLYNCL